MLHDPKFFQQVTAAAVTLILIVLFLWPRKKQPKWDISSHYSYLSACIRCSANHKELDAYRERVDQFYDKYYGKISPEAIQRYYARLLQVISVKETQLNEAAKKVPAGA